jgi:nucleotide-binding universal stress UspA family protein
MKTFKNILVPVDFSENSKAAFEFAVGLAEDNKAKIKVVNINDDYALNSPLSDPLVMPNAKTLNEYEADLKKFLEAEDEEMGGTLVQRKVKIEHAIVIGNPVTELIKMSQSGNYDLLVMGTTGKKEFSEIMFGSTATQVSQKAYCPVLLVPSGSYYKGISSIVYACDFDHTAIKHVGIVADVAKTFEADVNLLFVKTADNDRMDYFHDAKEIRTLFETQAPKVHVTTRVVEEDSVVDGINKFSEEIRADLVTVITKHRNFWERLLHSSKTKEIAMYANEPVLVIHAD